MFKSAPYIPPNMKDCILCNIDPKENPTFLRDNGLWTILLNFKQPTLGASLIVLNRHEEALMNISEDEALAYLDSVRALDTALRHSFNPTRMNYLMLGGQVSHLHAHVVPRYNSKRGFADQIWEDLAYREGMPILKTEEKSPRVLEKIKSELLRYLLPR